jgi:predicted TIM-barrel fold metal-dependent hydrolase
VVVDSHVHLQPPRLARAVREFFGRFLPPDVFAYPIDHESTLCELFAVGVSEVWNLPYAHKPGVALGLNQASAALVADNPVPQLQIIGGATAHPRDEHPERIVEAALDDLGLKVVKLHCSVGDYEADDPGFDAMWRLLERRRVPTIVHAGHGIDGSTDTHELAALDRVASRHPGVPLIIAHTAHPAVDAALNVIDKHPNVYADLTPRVTEPVAVTDDDLEAHHDRMLFGSDAPNTAVRVETGIERVRRLSPQTQAAVLGANAQRLITEAG